MAILDEIDLLEECAKEARMSARRMLTTEARRAMIEIAERYEEQARLIRAQEKSKPQET
jgi:hypothetical protein